MARGKPIIDDVRQAKQAYAVVSRFGEKLAPLYADGGFVYEVWYGFRCTDDETGAYNLDMTVHNYHATKDVPDDGSAESKAWQDRMVAISNRLNVDRYLFADGTDWGVYGDWTDSDVWPKAFWYGEQDYTQRVVKALPASMSWRRRFTNHTKATDRAVIKRGLGVREPAPALMSTANPKLAMSVVDMDALADRLARGG